MDVLDCFVGSAENWVYLPSRRVTALLAFWNLLVNFLRWRSPILHSIGTLVPEQTQSGVGRREEGF